MAVPEGWREVRLGDDVDVRIGGTPSRAEPSFWAQNDERGHPWASIADLQDRWVRKTAERITDLGVERSNVKRVEPGTVLMSFKLTIGRVARATQPMFTNEAIAALVPGRAVSPDYLYYAAPVAASSGVADDAIKGKTLNKAKLLELPLLVPPLPEQRKIAAILSSVDETIEKTEAVIEQLQVVKKAMMEELLTRGIPGRHTRLVPLATEWRVGRVRPGLAEIPESWRLVRLTDEARLESGHTPSRQHPEYWNGDIPWVSLHDSRNLDGPSIMQTAQTIGPLGLANSSARLLPAGTVVFSRTATVGKCTVLGREMATSQDFANYVCGMGLRPRYLMHLMRHMQTEWKRLMAGSTHQTIYMPVFRDLQILLPPVEEQQEIVDVVDSTDARLAAEAGTLTELRRLKAALSAALLSGDLRVTPHEVSP
ncbi:MAG: restriction endonuclease subunit S [Nannocystis sp.]|nr:restriction endonuclease subunit S [Nannocystis sp.]